MKDNVRLIITFLIFLNITFLFSQDRTVDSLKIALKTAKHDTTRCNILNAMIEAEVDDAIWPKYNEQLITLTETKLKTTDPSQTEYIIYKKYYAGSLNNIGFIYTNEGNSAKALECYNKSLKIQSEIEDKQGVATSLNNIATIYNNQGDISKGLEYFSKSLKIREEIQDKEGVAASLNNIADIYDEQGNTTKALEYLSKSLKIREEIGNQKGMATCLNNMGLIYSKQGNITKALEYYTKSLTIQEENGNKQGIATSQNNIGSIYKNQGDVPKAMEYFTKSLTIREEIGDKKGITYSLQNIGLLYLMKKNYEKALDYLLRSINLSKELGYPQTIKSAAQNLNMIYKAKGDYKNALKYHEIYIVMKDSISNEETRKASLKTELKYEYEKQTLQDSIEYAKEKEITTIELQKQKTEIKAKHNQQYALYGGLILVLIFALFMFNRFKVTQKQKHIITQQKNLVEKKHKEITDSINYAERIQRSFLASEEMLHSNLKDFFVFFKPKDIVSGDFYFAEKLSNGDFALAIADSTGHGVPGAIMSLLNITSLEKAIEHNANPADILNDTRQTIINRLKRDGSLDGGKDGMDCSLLVFDFKNKKLQIAAANNPVWIIRNNELKEIKPDKMPVGKNDRENESFTLHEIQLQIGDTIYALTDGFPDQFGGPNGKKFMSKKLKELLLANSHLSMLEQKNILDTTFKNWVGDLEQVDDVCVIGIRI